MKLIDEQVLHKTFGVGRVLDVDKDIITIQFSDYIGRKKFQYPNAFENYLKMCRPSAQDSINNELMIVHEKIVEEKSQKEQLRMQQAAARLLTQKQALRKPAAKKPRATKKPVIAES